MTERSSSSITVHAGAGEVLAVIADFTRYPQWAGGIRAAEIVEDGAAGRARRVRFALDAGPLTDEYVLAYTWTGDHGVAWELAEPGRVVSGMSGSYRLEPDGAATHVVYELAVDVRIPMPGPLRRTAERRIIDTALRGLKRRVESEG